MSKPILCRFSHSFASVVSVIVLTLWLASSATGQPLSVSIQVIPGRAIVEGTCAPETTWSFRDSYAGIVGLSSRVEALKLFSSNQEVVVRKVAQGQFSSATPASRFSYQMNIRPPVGIFDSAKVSWVNDERGLLMLRDLLPAFGNGGEMSRGQPALRVRLDLPTGWRAYSSERQPGSAEFETDDFDSTVIVVGQNLRATTAANLTFITDGQWAFTDGEAVELAARVLKTYRGVFGSMANAKATVGLLPFPPSAPPDKWAAETRGSTVTLLMGKTPSKTGALAQLSTPLTHELFHLWVPNGLNLDGDYDWFYEGFTVYQAARTAVQLDLLTFPEFLTAIGRAYDGYLSGADRDRWSLIEASRRRWSVGQPSVYSKSMIIAFLCDLKLRMQSRNKRSLDDVYRKLFSDYGARQSTNFPQPKDGNDAVTSALAIDSGTQDIVRRFMANPGHVDLRQELEPFGLHVETFGLRTRVSVSERLTKQQRDLLKQLGYNGVTRAPRNKN